MNNLPLFRVLNENNLSVTLARVVTESTGFSDTYGTLLSTSDDEIYTFVAYIHAENSAQPLIVILLSPIRLHNILSPSSLS